MKFKLLVFTLNLLATASIVPMAMADDCSNLEKNHIWVSGYKKLEQAVAANDTKQAIVYGEGLLDICPRLPKLNYMMAQMYRKLGDDGKTLYYLQSATRYTKEFVVDSETLESMWTDRVFAEHPESRPENVEKLKTELESLQSSTKNLQTSYSSSNMAAEDAHKNYAIMMWSGVGITGVGLAATAAGTALLLTTDSPISYNPDNRSMARIDAIYAISWTLIGVGATAAVVGTFMTGFAGYHYTHSDSISMSLSPVGFNISGTF